MVRGGRLWASRRGSTSEKEGEGKALTSCGNTHFSHELMQTRKVIYSIPNAHGKKRERTMCPPPRGATGEHFVVAEKDLRPNPLLLRAGRTSKTSQNSLITTVRLNAASMVTTSSLNDYSPKAGCLQRYALAWCRIKWSHNSYVWLPPNVQLINNFSFNHWPVLKCHQSSETTAADTHPSQTN